MFEVEIRQISTDISLGVGILSHIQNRNYTQSLALAIGQSPHMSGIGQSS